MSDLYNEFPSWGEQGEYPSDGFFYEGGDQINQKHMDALWNGVNVHFNKLIEGVKDRVRDIHGDLILDDGAAVSTTGTTREIEVSSSDGLYVDGQYVNNVNTKTITLQSNGGSTTRTDSVWVDMNGQVDVSTDTTTVSDSRHKLAEVDVSTDDTIVDVRNTGRRIAYHFTSESFDSGQVPGGIRDGDLWHDSDASRSKLRQGGDWQTIVTEEDDVTVTAGDGLDGTETENLIGGADFSLNVDVAELLGTGITESSNNLELDESVIKDGGAKEVDAAELAGDDGTSGQFLQTNGTSTSWETIHSISKFDQESNISGLSEGDIAYSRNTNKLFVEDGL